VSGPIGDLAGWAVEVVFSLGYVGVFLVVALANLHLPAPTEVTLPLSGFLVGQGRFSFVLVMVWSTAAGLLIALLHYYPGAWIGKKRVRRFVRRLERFKLVSVSDLDKASAAFERHGGKAVVIGHLVPGIGALISLPAGIKRMPILRRAARTAPRASTAGPEAIPGRRRCRSTRRCR
jgi:membrane protein DedA with SNARE-associated domain